MNERLQKLILLCLFTTFLSACDVQSEKNGYKEVEGIIQISMIPSREPDGRRKFSSQVEMITNDAILLLIMDKDTKFIDPELPNGKLELGHMYRAQTVKLDLPKGSTMRVNAEIDAILQVTVLERIGVAGTDAPTREKVRLARAYKKTPQWREAAKRVDQIYHELSGDSVIYSSALIEFTGKDTPINCIQKEDLRGTFYCAGNQTVVLDRDWFAAMETNRGAYTRYEIYNMEYMLAHVYAHHFQILAGLHRPEHPQSGLTQKQIKNIIDYELQADCLAGVAMANMKLAEQTELGDITEAMAMAAEVADNGLQSATSPGTFPDTLMHGTRDTRFSAIIKGYKSPSITSCM